MAVERTIEGRTRKPNAVYATSTPAPPAMRNRDRLVMRGTEYPNGPRPATRVAAVVDASRLLDNTSDMARLFLFFFLSGGCSLVYQVVWLRTAMADFGVTTPLVSIVLSVFMAGLALGSLGAGALARRLEGRSPRTFLRLYAGAEAMIGASGVLVVPAFGWGRAWIAAGGAASEWGSAAYYLAAGACIALVLLPFCACMGATFPLAMAGIRRAYPAAAPRSFSFLYIANVLGAAAGVLGSAFVTIELVGFRRTLLLAVATNAVIAISAWRVAQAWPAFAPGGPSPAASIRAASRSESPASSRLALVILFATGVVSLAMEVVWTRLFTPFQGTVVYAFASTLAVYLLATSAGSWVYRARLAAAPPHGAWTRSVGGLAIAAAAAALLPLAAADPRWSTGQGVWMGALRVLLGVGPFCALVGALTPMLVDRYSGGDPSRAGSAYAINAAGCIAGPLLAGFALLPLAGERWTMALLAAPLLLLGIGIAASSGGDLEGGSTEGASGAPSRVRRLGRNPTRVVAAAAAALLLLLGTRDWETLYPQRIVRRDHTATVVAAEDDGGKHLFVNGIGMTVLTPITKMMVHLPLAFLDRPPERGLILCFGMGTSFRSLRSWDATATAVELVPSVPELFGFYHADGDTVRRSAAAHIVIDDARRFLERTRDSYDLITVDPPPPIEAAGSSLLYSRAFCALAAQRLRPGGILQHWLPEGDATVVAAVTRALTETFPHVRAFPAIEGWGLHFLASNAPLPLRSADDLAARLPAAAVADLLEWGTAPSAAVMFQRLLDREVPVEALLALDPAGAALSDDRPVNEYYMLRRARPLPG